MPGDQTGPLGPDGAFDIGDKASGLQVGLKIKLKECFVIVLREP